jgi:hypothetical protein
MTTYYIIQDYVYSPCRTGMNVILEFDAEYEEEARETFTQYVRAMLVDHPNSKCRFISFERTLGGWIDRSLAHATAEDLLDSCPDWFSRPGFYDKSHNLVLEAWEIIDRITYQHYSYFVTRLKPEGAMLDEYKEWQRRRSLK